MVNCYIQNCFEICCFTDGLRFACGLHMDITFMKVENYCTNLMCKNQATHFDDILHDVTMCDTHAPRYYRSIKLSKCSYYDCTTKPKYTEVVERTRFITDTQIIFRCEEHNSVKHYEMSEHQYLVCVESSRCTFTHCYASATYGYSTILLKERCAVHKLSKMIDLTYLVCLEDRCQKMARYCNPLDIRLIYCQDHAVPIYQLMFKCFTCNNEATTCIPNMLPTHCANCQSIKI